MCGRLVGVLLAIALLMGFCAAAETVRGDLEARFANEPRLEVDGIEYRMRNRLTSFLLIGVDRETSEMTMGSVYDGGQADFLALLVIDDDRDVIASILLNRDTMAEITTLTPLGEEAGTRTAQICLAHAYGDGQAQSCALTVRAVRKLLRDVPVDHYIALNMNAIATLNDAIGGVEVTLEEDFSAYDPEMVQGATLKLRGMQAEYFVRSRYGVGDQTNLSCMKRQRVYMDSMKETVMRRIQESPNFIGTIFDAVEELLVTDVRCGYLINLANKARMYEVLPVIGIKGESIMGDSGYMEFYPEDASIVDALLESYFEPA